MAGGRGSSKANAVAPGGAGGGPSQPSTKSLLKEAAEAAKQQRFDDVVRTAQAVLQKDTKNYAAHIYLGFALHKTNHIDEAEKSYQEASKIQPDDIRAWQGLVRIYDQQRAKNLGSYKSAVVRLAEIYRDANEMHKCQEVVDKFIDFVRTLDPERDSRLDIIDAYGIILPDSPIYPALEGRLPHPGRTYELLAKLIEDDEKEKINTLLGKLNGRIGTTKAGNTIQAKREVWTGSKRADVYRKLINWTNDDDVRRTYEEKLLQFCYDRLQVAPASEKPNHFDVVLKLAKDMVIIKHPFKLAWDISINWQDYKEIEEWDVNLLGEYCTFFPYSDLYKVLAAFLTSDLSPFPKPEKDFFGESAEDKGNAQNGDADGSEDESDGGAPTSVIPLTDEDRLLMMAEGVSGADSLLAYRLTGAYYQYLEDYESNVELMNKALKHIVMERQKIGRTFQNTNDALSLYLATSLVYYQSPRNHQEAKALFDKVLDHDPTRTSALIGVGLIYEEEEEYDEAIKFLERALERDKENLRVRTEAAWVYSLKGDHARAKDELESCLPLLLEKGRSAKPLLAQTQYRLGYCLWQIDTSKAWRKDRTQAYAQWISALKNDLNYAPAYTSLGIYYADYAKDKKRARRCFQKAVELSSSEVLSAERLARSFAEDGDWERVELVAQRVVDSGKVRPPPGSKRKGISWPFAALGVAHLNKQDYTKAIVSFQSATRISPNDYHSFVGLGESYHNSGKHISAIKAIQEAQKLEAASGGEISGSAWFTKFILANIYRELATFDEAIELYKQVVEERPNEDGVFISLIQTMVESALVSIESGYFGKAVKLASDTLTFTANAPSHLKETFNFWKAVADSCSVFSSVQGKVTEFPTDTIRKLISEDGPDVGGDIVKDIDGVGLGVILAQGIFSDDEKVGVDLMRCLHATILAHKRAVRVSAHDVHAQAVAYYNLGWAEHRAHTCLPASLKKKPSRYLKAAVRCFKRAIELEAGNAAFWNALGVATGSINVAVSQHSFVRSLYLNERNAHVWANLGTLALLQNDIELANQAFTNAQSNEPEYAHGWLGQGFVALMLGHVKEARGLFTHAMGLSEASSLVTRQQYPVSVFDHILSAPPSLTVLDFVLPVFALSQLRRLRPQELPYGHLFSLFQERINDSQSSVPLLEEICGTLEADYEITESAASLKQFALAKTDLARAYLAAGSYEQAIECGEMALQLSSDESDNELSAEERKKARLSAHLTVGLAQYYSEDFTEALTYFEAALQESDNNPDAVCLLAQILWAKGTEDSRERARTVLFEVIEKDSEHVQSVLLLGVIALLDGDEESLEAVLAELYSMQTRDKVATAQREQIGEVLYAIASLAGEGADGRSENAKTQAQTDIMLYPNLPIGWSNLAALADGEQDYPAQMALKVALKAIPPRGNLSAADLSKVYADTGRPADAQAAIMIAPWVEDGWEALGDAVGK